MPVSTKQIGEILGVDRFWSKVNKDGKMPDQSISEYSKCVRPGHLKCGTQGENVNDMVRRNRMRPGFGGGFIRGSMSPMAKLNEMTIRLIRRFSKLSRGNAKWIAARLGVSNGLVSEINSRNLWAHVQ